MPIKKCLLISMMLEGEEPVNTFHPLVGDSRLLMASKDQERAGAMVCQMPLTASRQPSR